MYQLEFQPFLKLALESLLLQLSIQQILDRSESLICLFQSQLCRIFVFDIFQIVHIIPSPLMTHTGKLI
nr:MAG TPA: hypothetical protein [Caudoviricetes sp.]